MTALTDPQLHSQHTMKKLATVFLLSLLAALALAEAARESCQRELVGRSLDRCRSWLAHGRPGMMATEEEEEEDNEDVPRACCQQLGQVSEKCRCDLVRNMMEEVAWEEGFRGGRCAGRCGEMAMRAKFLPAMCSMAPQKCSIRRGGGGRSSVY